MLGQVYSTPAPYGVTPMGDNVIFLREGVANVCAPARPRAQPAIAAMLRDSYEVGKRTIGRLRDSW
jgi:hypothetical protein